MYSATDDVPTAAPWHPFTRTVCGCAECQQCCRDQPGPLAPGDFERIAGYLGETPIEAQAHFWASPGAVLGTRSGQMLRVGTITPRRVNGRCTFLSDAGACTIHPVAPFGCAYFDPHQPVEEGQRRSVWLHLAIHRLPAYARLRARLMTATSWRPKF
jgi:Fe-S-cluster containining protein